MSAAIPVVNAIYKAHSSHEDVACGLAKCALANGQTLARRLTCQIG